MLRHWPDLARSNARSIADPLDIIVFYPKPDCQPMNQKFWNA